MILIKCIPECIVYHCINELTVVHTVSVTTLHHCVRSHRHILHTTCNNDVSIACFDHLSSHVHTVQARAADNVDGDSGGLDGQAGFQRSLACNVLAQTSLDNTAHVNVVNLLRLDIGAVQGFLDDDGAQLCSRNIGQGAAELADSSTACGCDNDFLHKKQPPKNMNLI